MVVMVEAHLIEALERFPEPVSLFNGFMIQPWKGRFVLTCYDDPVVTITPNELGGAYPARDIQYAVALVGERLLALVNLAANAYMRGKESAGGAMPATNDAAEMATMAVPAAVAAAAAMPASSLDDMLAPAAPVEDVPEDDSIDGIFDEFDSDDSIDNVSPPPAAEDDLGFDLDDPAPEPVPEPEEVAAAPAEEPAPEPEPEPDVDDFDIDDLPDSVDIATDEDGAPAEAEIQGDVAPAADEPLDQSAIDDLFG